jgi:hypothetical protein
MHADSKPRFSKLFMAHLDTEFQKQSNLVLKSLVADQVRDSSYLIMFNRYLQYHSFKGNKCIRLSVLNVILNLSVRVSFLS